MAMTDNFVLDKLILEQIAYGSQGYRLSLALRDDVLRKPLGLSVYDDPLDRERSDWHLGAFLDGQLIAVLVLTRINDTTVKVRQVAVHSSMQGQGIGRMLTQHSEYLAREMGYLEMVLHARITAVPFYEKMGYTVIGKEFREVTIPHLKMVKHLYEAEDGTPTYRQAVYSDMPALVNLYIELACHILQETNDDYWDAEVLSFDQVSGQLKAFFLDPQKRIFVACVGEDLVAFIAGEPVSSFLPVSSIKRVGYISAAYVQPDFRGAGVMKQLESLILRHFKSLDLKYAELHFLSANTLARKSWDALGYKTFREQARKFIP